MDQSSRSNRRGSGGERLGRGDVGSTTFFFTSPRIESLSLLNSPKNFPMPPTGKALVKSTSTPRTSGCGSGNWRGSLHRIAQTDKRLMSAYERRYLASLPNRLTIFRGSQSMQVQGWSWTLDEKKALWFAKRLERLGFGIPRVTTGRAKKSDVIAYFSRRKEKEIVIDPSRVKIVQIVKVPKSDSS